MNANRLGRCRASLLRHFFSCDDPMRCVSGFVSITMLTICLRPGSSTEVWLRGGVRLRGTLRLDHEILFIEETRILDLPLAVDGVAFTCSEMESCLRLD
jgi:hypothetical protein